MEAEGILRSPVSCALSMHSSPRYLPLSRKIEVSSLLQFAGEKKGNKYYYNTTILGHKITRNYELFSFPFFRFPVGT